MDHTSFPGMQPHALRAVVLKASLGGQYTLLLGSSPSMQGDRDNQQGRVAHRGMGMSRPRSVIHLPSRRRIAIRPSI
eukprot:5815265-Pyramimonas_sp.AAC.1